MLQIKSLGGSAIVGVVVVDTVAVVAACDDNDAVLSGVLLLRTPGPAWLAAASPGIFTAAALVGVAAFSGPSAVALILCLDISTACTIA